MDWRKTAEYRRWRVAVIRRDGVCQICNRRKNRQAHHINSASYFPDERFNVDNGITLCRSCHSQFHNNYKKSTRQKCTKDDWDNFCVLVEYVKNLGGE